MDTVKAPEEDWARLTVSEEDERWKSVAGDCCCVVMDVIDCTVVVWVCSVLVELVVGLIVHRLAVCVV
jgi:hypothetical protein